jgi:hypothetical protein
MVSRCVEPGCWPSRKSSTRNSRWSSGRPGTWPNPPSREARDRLSEKVAASARGGCSSARPGWRREGGAMAPMIPTHRCKGTKASRTSARVAIAPPRSRPDAGRTNFGRAVGRHGDRVRCTPRGCQGAVHNEATNARASTFGLGRSPAPLRDGSNEGLLMSCKSGPSAPSFFSVLYDKTNASSRRGRHHRRTLRGGCRLDGTRARRRVRLRHERRLGAGDKKTGDASPHLRYRVWRRHRERRGSG